MRRCRAEIKNALYTPLLRHTRAFAASLVEGSAQVELGWYYADQLRASYVALGTGIDLQELVWINKVAAKIGAHTMVRTFATADAMKWFCEQAQTFDA